MHSIIFLSIEWNLDRKKYEDWREEGKKDREAIDKSMVYLSESFTRL